MCYDVSIHHTYRYLPVLDTEFTLSWWCPTAFYLLYQPVIVHLCHCSHSALRSMQTFLPLRKMHVLKELNCFVAQELCLIMCVNSLRCVCIHVHRSGETRRGGIIHTHFPHGSTHRQSWHRVVRHSCLWFTVPFCVCSALFADHLPHRSIRRGVRASMNNRFHPGHFLPFLWLRIPILSGGKRLKSRWNI